MTQQKSENPIVPEDLRKSVPIQESALDVLEGGGKGIPVNEETDQSELHFATAENLEMKMEKTNDKLEDVNLISSGTIEVPKAKDKGGKRWSATMSMVIGRLGKAWRKVASNKGAPGPDGKTIEDVQGNIQETLNTLKDHLISGEYGVGAIRRVFIPKPDGKGERGLGIPNVEDRIVQQAIRMVLEPLYEPEFHDGSHGFRPGRSCHTAIEVAKSYVSMGHEWVVDIDLEKFFDRVNHQRLMGKLAEKVGDKSLLILLGQLLKAKVLMPEGLEVRTEEGVPQGGPLSPLLSNIVLDELDWELDRRGHKFVRYADDANIFVKSERAGDRVMASISAFIEGRLQLKVNKDKSAVGFPHDRHFLGFRLKVDILEDKVDILLSERSKQRIATRTKELTPRNWGNSLKVCIERLNEYLKGWYGFFKICTKEEMGRYDAHIRRRLRAIMFKQWKRKRTMAKKLVANGAKRRSAFKHIYSGRKSIWRLTHGIYVSVTLSKKKFEEMGLISLKDMWLAYQKMGVPEEQLMLPLV